MEQTPLPTFSRWTPRNVALATLTVLGVGLGFYLFVQFRLVFFLLFTAIVLSTAFTPIVQLLEKWHIPRSMGVILIALIGVAAGALFVQVLAPLILNQGATMVSLLATWYQQFHQGMMLSSSLILRRIGYQLPYLLPLGDVPAVGATPAPTNNIESLSQTLALLNSTVGEILTIGAVALLAGVWILEGERTSKMVLMIFPSSQRETVREFFGQAGLKVGAYVRGLAILSAVIGGMAMLAYLIIGLPNVLLLGILAAIFELVPLVGPLLASIPALLVAASVDPSKVLPVIIASIIIQLLENNLVVPRVMDRAVGVNPIVSLLAFLAFGALFGFVGALLAIPLAAILQITLNRFVFQARPIDTPAPVGRTAISALRYETQDLVLDVRKYVREKPLSPDSRADEVEDSMESIAQDLDSILAQIEPDPPDAVMSNTAERLP